MFPTCAFESENFMKTSRRDFIRLGGAAALAGLVNPTVEAGTTRLLSSPLSISATEQTLLDFIKTYATEVRFVGVGVLEKLRLGTAKHVHILASVPDLADLADALTHFPFTAYSQGSSFSFEVDGTEFTVENLPPQAFGERRVLLSKARSIAFGHDALSYEPGSSEIFDPFNASKGDTLKSVNRTFGGISGLEVIIRGLVEAQQLQLALGADFTRWMKRMLRFVAKSKDSAALTQVFLRQLATAASALTEAQVKELLRSANVSSALQAELGIDVEAAIAAYDTLRAQADGSVSNGAIWLAVLLKAQLDEERSTGVVSPLLRSGNRFQVLRSLQALKQAVSIAG